MFAFELLFSFDSITNTISGWIASIDGWIVYIIMYIVMVIQVSFIPIPVYVIVNAAIIIPSINLSLSSGTGWIFIAVIMAAYMSGVIISYLLGRKLGSRALKWCAGDQETYDKWAKTINKKGKWWYAITVVLPVFPDDILCLIAGSVKFNFAFYILANFIGRLIGLIVMIAALQVMQLANSGGFPFTTLAWGLALVALFICYIIVGQKLKKERLQNK